MFTLQSQQSHRLVILAAIFVLMTLLILYGSNNIDDDMFYAPFHVATNHPLRTTDLKKWAGREGYVPVYGNKVRNRLHTNTEMFQVFRKTLMV